MNITIVEDNKALRESLKNHLSQSALTRHVVEEAACVVTALTALKKSKIDVALLDVEIEGGLIFDVLNQIPELDFDIIFLSAHDSYAINAFRYNALNYLLKPIDFNELDRQLDAVYKKNKEIRTHQNLRMQLAELEKNLFLSKTEKIALPAIDGIRFYRYSDISWIKADANYCHFILRSGAKVVVSKPLKEFEDLLEIQGFYRVHKSSMINLSFVQQYIKGDGGTVILEDHSEIQVSRRKKEGLLDALLNHKVMPI